MKIYKAIIRPVLTYACATRTLRKIHAEKIDRFERKVLRRIMGPVIENGAYRLRKNKEIYDLYDDLRVSHFVRIQRFKWLGHLVRMDDDRAVKKLYYGAPDGTRPRGRPKGRWKDSVAEDLRMTGVSSRHAADRNEWEKAVERAKGSFR